MTKQKYFKEFAESLFAVGCEVIPIVPNKKFPAIEDWRSMEITEAMVKEWVDTKGWYGVGIRGSSLPAIDVDITDHEVAQAMAGFIDDLIGRGPVRIGQEPKLLIPVSTRIPRKHKSPVYIDDGGRRHAIELLSNGQQWVAYGYHEEAGRDYRWDRGDLATAMLVESLPELDEYQLDRIFEEFDRLARGKGWLIYRQADVKEASKTEVAIDPEDAILDGIKRQVGLTIKDLSDIIMEFPCDTYDDWYRGGMAIFHETKGSQAGFELFDEWSSNGVGYDGTDATREKWETFSSVGPGGDTVTIRSYIYELNERAKTSSRSARESFWGRISGCTDPDVLIDDVCPEIARNKQLTAIDRELLATKIQHCYRKLSGASIPIAMVRGLLAKKGEKEEAASAHPWAKEWCYVNDRDKYFNLRTKEMLSEKGFCANFDDLCEEGTTAAKVAIREVRIPTVETVVYDPREDAIFYPGGNARAGRRANLFRPESVPECLPEHEWTPKDKRNVELVKRHIEDTIISPWEARVLLDWMSWVVQNPGSIMSWAPLVVGVQGDGKTFMANMLGAVLGQENVGQLSFQVLQSGYTEWAAGKQLVIFDEVRAAGQNRYSVMETMKLYVGNKNVVINQKYVDSRSVQSTANYFLTSNHIDALPLDSDSRRFLPLKTRWTSREEMLASGERGDEYFNDLFAAIEVSVPALRQWLLTWEQGEDFSPRTLPSKATHLMERMSVITSDPTDDILVTLIEEDASPYIWCQAISSTALTRMAEVSDEHRLQGRRIKKFMVERGWTKLPGQRVKSDGVLHTFWVRPDLLDMLGEDCCRDMIVAGIKKRKQRLAVQELTEE